MELNKVRKDLKELRDAGFIDCNIQCLLDQLNKVTESVVVDQFIADWYEKYKDDFEYRLWEWFNHRSINDATENSEFYMWLNNSFNNPVETLVKMKLFGYKVKKEKLYFVKVKGVYENSNTLNYYADEDRWVNVIINKLMQGDKK